MSSLLLAATLTITLAFFAYTFGVFSERRAGTLKKGHLALFWLGLAFDTTGTTRIGKYIFNHSFMLPGLLSMAFCLAFGLLFANILL